MTYIHITTRELTLIESYYNNNQKVSFVAKQLNRSRQIIYSGYHALDEGLSTTDCIMNLDTL